MRKMSIGVGALVLVGMLVAVMGILFKVTTFNTLYPYLRYPRSFFLAANTCFLVAIIIDRFDSAE